MPGQKTTQGKADPAAIVTYGMVSVADIIAPAALEVDFDYLKIGDRFYRTLFVAGYPRFVTANWLSLLLTLFPAWTFPCLYIPLNPNRSFPI